MKKDKVLLDYLKGLSPLFQRLVEKALKEQINIITSDTFKKRIKKYGQEFYDVFMLGAGNYPKIGLGKIIMVSMTWVPRTIEEGNLGIAEMNFAHEIGHNLSWPDEPFCAFHPSSQFLRFQCSYFEVLADKLGFGILRELNPQGNLKLLFQGRPTKPLKIYNHYGFPSEYLKSCRTCYALKAHNLKSCPKRRKIRKFVEAMEKFEL